MLSGHFGRVKAHYLLVKSTMSCLCLFVSVVENTTGTNSVFTVFEGHEIMFHVSTLLPYSTGNIQQVHVCLYYTCEPYTYMYVGVCMHKLSTVIYVHVHVLCLCSQGLP